MLGKAIIKATGVKTTVLVNKNKVYPITDSLISVLRKNAAINMFSRQIFESDSSPFVGLDQVTFIAPVAESHFTIYCIGKNYLDHVNEVKGTAIGGGVPETPIVFSKALGSLTGPFATIKLPEPEVSKEVDYEGELAVVIGKEGLNISKKNALDYIFGVTVLNDVTARDKQRKHLQWLLGKSLDGFCPLGPIIVPLSDVKDSLVNGGLNIETKVNGEVRQKGNTNSLIFDIPTLIEEISKGVTLKVGDIIATGTPSGVGAGFTPPKFLKAGDEVKVSISEVGQIENTFV